MNSISRDLQKTLFDAEFNVAYFELLSRRYSCYDTAVRVALAAAAVAAVVCKSPTFAGAVTMVSTMLVPALKWHKLIPQIEATRVRWVDLKLEYENLWHDAKRAGDWRTAEKVMVKLRKHDNNLEKGKNLMPRHEGLLERAWKDVCRAHGLIAPTSEIKQPPKSLKQPCQDDRDSN